MKRSGIFLLVCLFTFVSTYAQSKGDIVVQAGRRGPAISSTMWGIFFEDINMAADGGLYAELVKNRSFEFQNPLMGWKEHGAPGNGTVLVINRGRETPANPRYIHVSHLSTEPFALSNEGFRGMGIREGETYHFSVWNRPQSGNPIVLRVELLAPDGRKLATARLPLHGASGQTGRQAAFSPGASSQTASPGSASQPSSFGSDNMASPGSALQPASPTSGSASQPISFSTGGWHKDTVSLTATASEAHAQLYCWFEGQGSVDLDMISLFPQHTWKQRPGGLRADLVQLLADMHPGFIRFPGGCIVEGRELATRYQWKKTVGNVEDRQLIINRWNTEFAHRPTPDYYQSFGLGFFEYFQLAEDIGAQPLPILNCGMACQFNTGELAPLGDLDPYVQDALDLIEFANGDVTTKWGALRQAMGHPAPFHLTMLGVGNEQWGPQYIERYTVFARAIHARYPELRLVNSVGPEPDDNRFRFLNDTLRRLQADILDEHYYRQPDWFLQNARRYDQYPRRGPRIFAGEYAAQSDKTVSPDNRNNWRCALAEAAYMTGLERNADVVRMASYAPLLAHADGWQWTPDLIWFDNFRSYGTPDYYVQKLYSTNRGSVVVPVLLDGQTVAGQDSLYATACLDTAAHELILKIVNVSDLARNQAIRLEGLQWVAREAQLTVLKSPVYSGVNSFEDPKAISPTAQTAPMKKDRVRLTLAPYSFTVLKLPFK